jgi:class 3 adenylate cyclase
VPEQDPGHAHAEVDPGYVYRGPFAYRALLGMPIKLDEDLIGVVVLVRGEPRAFSDAHIALVQTFADQAAIALTNARLLEAVDRQRTEVSRFLSPQVAELITSEGGERLLAGHRAYITCLFCDLRGFTAFAEAAAPEELFDVLRDYQGALGRLIPAHGGTLEHFAGDGLMVFFNDPLPLSDHELGAVRLALAAHERFEELAAVWRKRGTELGLGIGVEAGYATLGRIGFEGRYDYGAVGPVTNLASRLSTHAGGRPTRYSSSLELLADLGWSCPLIVSDQRPVRPLPHLVSVPPRPSTQLARGRPERCPGSRRRRL